MTIGGFDLNAIFQQYLQQAGINLNAVNGTNNITAATNGVNTANTTQQTQTAGNGGKTPEQLQTEIDQLKQDKADNNTKIKEAKEKIQNLVAEIKTDLHESKELKEKAIDRHKNQVDRMVERKIEEYNKANRDGGEGMTKDELEKNISSSMPKNPDLSKAIAKELVANEKLGEIEKLNTEIDKLEIENKTIDEDIKVKTDAKAKAQEAQKQAQQQAGANGAAGNTDGTAGATAAAGGDGGGGYSYEQQIADLKASYNNAKNQADSYQADDPQYVAAQQELNRTAGLLAENGVDVNAPAAEQQQEETQPEEPSGDGA